MSCNNVKTFWKSFVCLFGLGSNTLFVKVVFWKGSKSYLTSLLIHEYIIDVWHQTWCLLLLWHLEALFHFSVGIRYEHPAWPGTDSHELQKCFFLFFFFLRHGWLHLLFPVTPTILKSSLLILLSSWLSFNFCPERIRWEKTGSPLLTEFFLAFSWLLINTVTMIINQSFHLYHETHKVIKYIKLLDIKYIYLFFNDSFSNLEYN